MASLLIPPDAFAVHHALCKAKARPELVDVPRFNCLMIDGQGAPETSRQFQEAIQALYGLTFTAKFSLKVKGRTPDYKVAALEGLWWAENGEEFGTGDQADWSWTLLLVQPDFVDEKLIGESRLLLAKRGRSSASVEQARLEFFEEGRCMQILHVGPYTEEKPTVDRMLAFASENGLEPHGKHHEIYLGDPRRADPGRLRTLLRLPVRAKTG